MFPCFMYEASQIFSYRCSILSLHQGKILLIVFPHCHPLFRQSLSIEDDLLSQWFGWFWSVETNMGSPDSLTLGTWCECVDSLWADALLIQTSMCLQFMGLSFSTPSQIPLLHFHGSAFSRETVWMLHFIMELLSTSLNLYWWRISDLLAWRSWYCLNLTLNEFIC